MVCRRCTAVKHRYQSDFRFGCNLVYTEHLNGSSTMRLVLGPWCTSRILESQHCSMKCPAPNVDDAKVRNDCTATQMIALSLSQSAQEACCNEPRPTSDGRLFVPFRNEGHSMSHIRFGQLGRKNLPLNPISDMIGPGASSDVIPVVSDFQHLHVQTPRMPGLYVCKSACLPACLPGHFRERVGIANGAANSFVSISQLSTAVCPSCTVESMASTSQRIRSARLQKQKQNSNRPRKTLSWICGRGRIGDRMENPQVSSSNEAPSSVLFATRFCHLTTV